MFINQMVGIMKPSWLSKSHSGMINHDSFIVAE